MEKTIEQLLLCLLTALLAIAGTRIYDKINRSNRKKDIYPGIIAEIKDLKVRLVSNVFILANNLGKGDRELYKWLKEQMEGANGSHPTQDIMKCLDVLLERDNEKYIPDIQQVYQANPTGLNLKTFDLFFVKSHIHLIPFFKKQFQTLALEILQKINIINEEIGTSTFYLQNTFKVSGEAYNTSKNNMMKSYGGILEQCKETIKMINKLISCKP